MSAGTVLDIAVLAVIGLYFLTGLRQGLFVALGTLIGFVLGAAAAVYATPWMIDQVGAQWHLLVALGTVIVCLVLGQTIGMALGRSLRRITDSTPLRGLERLAGGVLNLLVSALVIVTIVLLLRPLGLPAVTAATTDSRVISWMMSVTPLTLQDKVTEIRGQVIDASALPEVTSLIFPEQAAPSEPLSNPVLEKASSSVVQVLGAAQACNYTSEGSGFAVDGGLVVTNAHVLAGVSTPTLLARGGEAATGEVIYFDEALDIAIISAPDLGVDPLSIDASEIAAGTTVSFMGYPGGGGFQSKPATVQGLGITQTVDAQSGATNPSRLVYQLAADVQQGNSGGPVLTEDGTVMAMIFAKATQGQSGYAVPASSIVDALNQVEVGAQTVATGACVA